MGYSVDGYLRYGVLFNLDDVGNGHDLMNDEGLWCQDVNVMGIHHYDYCEQAIVFHVDGYFCSYDASAKAIDISKLVSVDYGKWNWALEFACNEMLVPYSQPQWYLTGEIF